MSPKPKKDACSKVMTIPQVTGTCWFNGLLMCILYSQHSNKMMRRIIPLWAKDRKRKPRLARAYDLMHAMVMKYHTVKSETERLQAFKYFETITPEHILETLHQLSPSKFKFNPVVTEGFNINYYISVLYKLLKVRALLLETDIDSTTGDYVYYVSRFTNVDMHFTAENKLKLKYRSFTRAEIEAMIAHDSFDCIVVSYRDDEVRKFDNPPAPHWSVDKHISRMHKDDESYPHTLKFKGDNYKLDSTLLTSFHTDSCLHHVISGVSCNYKHRVYNGWMRSTNDAAAGTSNDAIMDMAVPCELMDFDWNKDNATFCINRHQCSLDRVDGVKGLCFNFNKGDRLAFYVNSKFAKPRFKHAPEEANAHTPLQQTVPSISDKRPVLDDEKWNDKQRLCVRRVANWSALKPYHKFDSAAFNPKDLLKDLPTASPKLQTLLETIEKLNAADKEAHGHNHKHFIFSDLGFGYGAKIIASALLAKGYKLAYNQNHQLVTPDSDNNAKARSKAQHKPHFAILSSSTIYGKPMTQKTKKAILASFNSRPDNVYGKNIQIIILDSGFKEGIDLFDVKYVHVFEPQISLADQRQVIGRATRTCGQKGLTFDPNQGWPLEVRIYDSQFSRVVRDRKFDLNTMHELYLSKSGIDIRTNNFVAELEKYSAQAAVDATLNKAIHSNARMAHRDASPTQVMKPKKRKITIIKPLKQASPPPTSQQTGGIVIATDIANGKVPAKTAKTTELYKRWQTEVTKKYSKTAKWVVNGLENLCVDKPQPQGNANTSFKKTLSFTPSQELIRQYLTSNTPTNGLLAYHSVGTGKTCSAIATASSSFEKEGYTILWVTRTTLKSDMWKNMFDQVCNVNLQGIANQMPNEMAARKRLLSKAWRIPPMSYRQFTNMLQGKNEFYKTLVSINGKEDPLRKTLLIIDEAHKLFNAEDLKTVERPDTDTLYRMLQSSYAQSGADAVKLLLMTATPITNNPMDYIKMLNLFKTKDVAMPDDFESFIAAYLDRNTGKFTKDGAKLFMNQIAGIISYLNRERDARQFAQPKISIVNTNISERRQALERPEQVLLKYGADEQRAKKKILEYKDNIEDIKAQYEESKRSDEASIEKLKTQLEQEMAEKTAAPKGKKEAAQAKVNELREKIALIKQITKTRKETMTKRVNELKAKIDEQQAEAKQLKRDKAHAFKEMKVDFSQERLMGLCAYKSVQDSDDKNA